MDRSQKEFAEKLYEILTDPQNFPIVEWSSDGRSFLINDQISFSEKILQKYFKHKNLNSFVRQLNKYDFHKIKNGEKNEFANQNFQRGRVDLLEKIRRKKTGEKKEFSEMDNDMAEKCLLLQNQMLSALKMLGQHFQMISEDMVELKKMIMGNREARSPSILIYEENLNMRMFVISFSQKQNFNVFVAECKNDVLSFLQSKKFDLIVISNSVVDLVNLLSEIRRVDPRVILFVTGMSFSRVECANFRKLCVDELILKPFSLKQFVAIIEKYDLDGKKENLKSPYEKFN